jgi:hypothetical protein
MLSLPKHLARAAGMPNPTDVSEMPGKLSMAFFFNITKITSY